MHNCNLSRAYIKKGHTPIQVYPVLNTYTSFVVCSCIICISIKMNLNAYILVSAFRSTVGSLILRNRFLQIALKLLNTLLCKFAACNFDHMSSGETPVRLQHLVVEIFAKNHSAKIVNEL